MIEFGLFDENPSQIKYSAGNVPADTELENIKYVCVGKHQVWPKADGHLDDVYIDIDFSKRYDDPTQISGMVGNEVVTNLLKGVYLYEGKYLGDGRMALCRLKSQRGTDELWYPDGTYISPDYSIDVFFKFPEFHIKVEDMAGYIKRVYLGEGYTNDINYLNMGRNELLGCRQGGIENGTYVAWHNSWKNPGTASYQVNHDRCASRGKGYVGSMQRLRSALVWVYLMRSGKWYCAGDGNMSMASVFNEDTHGIDRLWYQDSAAFHEHIDNIIIINGEVWETEPDGSTPKTYITTIPVSNSLMQFPVNNIIGGRNCDIYPTEGVVHGVMSVCWSDSRVGNARIRANADANVDNERSRLINYSYDSATNTAQPRLCFSGELIDYTDRFEEFKELPYINNDAMVGHLKLWYE